MSEQKIYKPTPEELKTILENHMHWWKEDCEGWEEMRADLRNADLSGADLSGAYLSGADLRNADLSGADLSGADLSGADLSGADLRNADLRNAYLMNAYLSGAYLSGAYLMNADLRNADLSGAYLSGAYLSGAYLRNAYLRNAYLRNADLSGAYLRNADLSGADLSGVYLRNAYLMNADLRNADLSGAKGLNYPIVCPSDGAFIGWKKAWTDSGIAIVKLQITEDAKRSSATGRKCRCDKAQVLAIYNAEGKEVEEARSDRDNDFIYRPGEIVIPDSFDDDRWNECSHGIHFFITRQEAEEYDL